MQKVMKLRTKFMLLVIIVVLISLSIVTVLTTSWMTKNIENEARTNIMNVGEMTAHSKEIISELKRKDPDKRIGAEIDLQLKSLDQIQYIIVADMNGIRYSHPNPDRIGEKFIGGDEKRVLQKGETYISEATGTLGKALRAFTPIYDEESGKQIGFVSVGTLTERVGNLKILAVRFFILMALWGLGIGIVGAFLLANNIKKILLGLEPDEISRLYHEKIGILDAVHEGLVAIDKNNRITLINDSALRILQVKDKYKKSELLGKDVEDFIPNTRLKEVLESGISEYDREQKINDTVIMTNRVPVRDRGKVIGAMASFRDKTELIHLAEELTGVRQIVDALRANNHEFMNKLHTILGLLFMEDTEEAKGYITKITDKQQKLVNFITSKVQDSTIAGLLLGKFSRASEMDVYFKIDEASSLEKSHGTISSSTLVTIIGNLVENAMEAVNKRGGSEKYVYVMIKEEEEGIEIEVEDSGIGIDEQNLEVIFKRGYTTKEGSEGVGLATVKETIDNLGGFIGINSEVNVGTVFNVYLPK
jgi:sensor histidine kinase regulating citrate/malate metabolism